MTTAAMTHDEFQSQTVEASHVMGWSHLHVRRSIGKGKKWVTTTNVKGWPDLFLWHPRRGGFLAIELKVWPDKARPDQTDVLMSLAFAGMTAAVVYPEDWDAVVVPLLKREQPGSGKRSYVVAVERHPQQV